MSTPQQEIHILGPDGVPIGVIRPRPPAPRQLWLHALLLAVTVLTTTVFGGLAFSLPLLVILLAHESGHYLACRHYGLDASLPYFIPMPFGIGTLGAVIRIRSPLLTKRELFDVGAAGPLAGFVVALPVLLVGILLSKPVTELPTGGMVFGEPLAVNALAALIHPHVPPGADLLLHPTGFAAWFGLLATAFNLLPFGQLDGGHITYAMFGRLQRRIAWPLWLVLVALGFKWPGWWVAAALTAFLVRVRHPWIPDEATTLDRRRMLLGWLCIAIFLLCFTPEPVKLLP